jgi:hypothetical protein
MTEDRIIYAYEKTGSLCTIYISPNPMGDVATMDDDKGIGVATALQALGQATGKRWKHEGHYRESYYHRFEEVKQEKSK